MKSLTCSSCGIALKSRWQKKYCSNKCQADAQYQNFKSAWLSGKLNVVTKNISGHIKRFLLDTYGHKCMDCGWNKKHPITGKVPVEVDHIDGNADNNTKDNLRLICPNCHALSPSFRNLNKGNGRAWRKAYFAKR